MNHYLISDTHFGHRKMEMMCDRPANFETKIIDNLGKITEDDILYHVGDVSFYNHDYWHPTFLGVCKAKKKILVIGNHDRQTKSKYYEYGWDFVCDELTVKMFGYRIIMTHFPMLNNELYNESVDTLNVHGHIHTHTPNLTKQHKSIVLEHHYSPVLLRTLIGA